MDHQRSTTGARALLAAAIVGVLLADAPATARSLYKRSFVQSGCRGEFVPSYFARLDRVCEECYQIYHKPFILDACRSDCFRNETFLLCTDALMLHREKEALSAMVDQLYGADMA